MSAYLSAVIADAPLHYWRCADPPGSLILIDIGSSPYHLHAVGVNAIIGYSGPVSDGGCVDLALDSSFANSGENIAAAVAAMSMECIVWPFEHHAITNQWTSLAIGAPHQQALFNSAGKWGFIYKNTVVPAAPVTNVADQTWTHLVGTYNGANAQLYVNGAASGAAVAIAADVAYNDLFTLMGSVNTGSRGFIAEVAYYNTALSAARVLAHYNAIDRINQPPIYSRAGVGSTSSGDLGLLAYILQSVRKIY